MKRKTNSRKQKALSKVEILERRAIMAALRAHHDSVGKAATFLGIKKSVVEAVSDSWSWRSK